MISRIGDWFGWVIEPAVDRLHVSASNVDVVRACRQAMTRDARAREHRQARHEFMRAAIEHHQDNRRMFALRNAGFAVHEVALLMDDEKRQSELNMVLFDAMPREYRARAAENEVLIFDYWAGVIGGYALDVAMRITDPDKLREYLERAKNERMR